METLLNRETYKTTFHELFIQDPVSQELIDVPVDIFNLENENSRRNEELPAAERTYVRRFFLYDNVSAVRTSGGYIVNEAPFLVRFAHTMRFLVEMQKDKAKFIYKPKLEILYKEKVDNLIKDKPREEVEIESDFFMNLDAEISAIKTFFWIGAIGTIVFWIMRMYIWSLLNPSDLSPDNYIFYISITGIMKLFKIWSYYILLFTTILTSIWFIFFKLQDRIYLLLPKNNSWREIYFPLDVFF